MTLEAKARASNGGSNGHNLRLDRVKPVLPSKYRTVVLTSTKLALYAPQSALGDSGHPEPQPTPTSPTTPHLLPVLTGATATGPGPVCRQDVGLGDFVDTGAGQRRGVEWRRVEDRADRGWTKIKRLILSARRATGPAPLRTALLNRRSAR
jgi:hypothetical protein